MKHFACAGVCLVLVTLPATRVVNHAVTRVAYNSEEHKLLADRGASRVNPRSAVLPFPTRFWDTTSAVLVDRFQDAKQLAVGFRGNVEPDEADTIRKVQDNSYWDGYRQRAENVQIYIPTATEAGTRTLVVTAWDGASDGTFTFGELVALYGDYRKTAYCDDDHCYLTNKNSSQYRIQSATHAAGYTYFEYGEDCFGIPIAANCGWEPDPRRTRTYLQHIGSGLIPPYGQFGNVVSNTAWEEEELDAGWWGDEMMRNAQINDWHFSQAAVAWYIGMHRLALRYVEMARSNPKYWNHALHYEANALHSLTDIFAFGHLVTSRDETSRGIMVNEGLTDSSSLKWMENVLRQGGGRRAANGRVTLHADSFLTTAELTHSRNEFMPSYAGTWASTALFEKTYHTSFNDAGATVMNLKRQEFSIKGDALFEVHKGTWSIIEETVRVSLQSLFDAYESTKPIAEIGAAGSPFFDALLNIPIYVKTNAGNEFWGMWTRYAKAVDRITGAGVVNLSSTCVVPFMDGQTGRPAARASACETPVLPPNSAVVNELLQRNGALARGDQQGLDAAGNVNGSYDVGDFLAWVRRTGATPASLAAQAKGCSR